MTSFNLKGLINPILNDGVPSGSTIINLLPGGHADLDRGHPSLLKDLSRGIQIVKVHPTSFEPKEIKDEAPEDVEGLPDVRESPGVVALEFGGVVLALVDGFPQQDEGPGGSDIPRGSSF